MSSDDDSDDDSNIVPWAGGESDDELLADVDPADCIVKRWRGGHQERLYVTVYPDERLSPIEVGWWDLAANQPHPASQERLTLLTATVSHWRQALAATHPHGTPDPPRVHRRELDEMDRAVAEHRRELGLPDAPLQLRRAPLHQRSRKLGHAGAWYAWVRDPEVRARDDSVWLVSLRLEIQQVIPLGHAFRAPTDVTSTTD